MNPQQEVYHGGHTDYRINSVEDTLQKIILWEATFCNHCRNWLHHCEAQRSVLKHAVLFSTLGNQKTLDLQTSHRIKK